MMTYSIKIDFYRNLAICSHYNHRPSVLVTIIRSIHFPYLCFLRNLVLNRQRKHMLNNFIRTKKIKSDWWQARTNSPSESLRVCTPVSISGFASTFETLSWHSNSAILSTLKWLHQYNTQFPFLIIFLSAFSPQWSEIQQNIMSYHILYSKYWIKCLVFSYLCLLLLWHFLMANRTSFLQILTHSNNCIKTI